jgi:general secretion pathway protein B
MSYILDALKKADAQRERDPARGIHAQPGALAPARDGEPVAPWMWAAGAVVVAAVAATGWVLLQQHETVAAPPTVVQAAAPAGSRAAPAAPTAPAVAPPAVSARAGEQVAAVVLPPPEPPRAVARSEPDEPGAGAVRHRPRVGAPASTLSPLPAGASSVAAPAAPAAPHGAAPASAVAAAAPSAAVAPLATGLPPDAPKLAITGGVYSANRSQRMLIVNGQVVNEGADLGAGVVVEEIKPKSAVLRFRGGRYSVAF